MSPLNPTGSSSGQYVCLISARIPPQEFRIVRNESISLSLFINVYSTACFLPASYVASASQPFSPAHDCRKTTWQTCKVKSLPGTKQLPKLPRTLIAIIISVKQLVSINYYIIKRLLSIPDSNRNSASPLCTVNYTLFYRFCAKTRITIILKTNLKREEFLK